MPGSSRVLRTSATGGGNNGVKERVILKGILLTDAVPNKENQNVRIKNAFLSFVFLPDS